MKTIFTRLTEIFFKIFPGLVKKEVVVEPKPEPKYFKMEDIKPLIGRGIFLLKEEDLAGAIILFSHVIELKSFEEKEKAICYFGRSHAYRKQGKVELAEADLAKATELDGEVVKMKFKY